MSDNLPPSGPPSGPPGPTWGPPTGPPAGPPPPPPSHATWHDGSAEVLQSGRGEPVPSGHPRGRGGRRAGFVAGGALAGVAVLAAGAWAGYAMFFATGSQPAEALPDTTVGYVSVDLDPSGKQKLEALETLRRFPAFAENVDIEADDDLRLRIFEQIQGEGLCPEIDFADDIDPWLGNRFAAAAIELADTDDSGLGVTGVGVVQIDDADAADEGLGALSACAGDDESFGWSIAGDWAVVAETTEIAEEVIEAAEDAPLSDDDDFQRWTDEAGDPGILTGYLAPAAGPLLADAVAGFAGLGALGLSESLDVPELPTEVTSMFDGFEGAALTIRFADGGLEIETASGSSQQAAVESISSSAGAEVVATLPADTAVAFGIGLEEGWFDDISQSADDVLGDGGLEGLLAGGAGATGLDLPDDIETLLGESTAIALGGDADLTAFSESEPPTDLPLGVKVKGDADAITGVLDTLLGTTDDESLGTLLGYEADDDIVVAGPSADYRASLIEDGGLGDSDAFQDAVINADDAAAVLFINVDAGPWLTSFPLLDEEILANLRPLSAIGFSSWIDDDVNHAALRITTE